MIKMIEMPREEAIKMIKDDIRLHHDELSGRYRHVLNMAIKALKQPEIIRCKDCKHYNAGFECLIEGYGIERSADWYCADAERRTDDKTNKGSSC